MKSLNFVVTLGIALALPSIFAAEEEKSGSATAKENSFIRGAAEGGMTEVALGKIAQSSGVREDVKKFGGQMVKDHGQANDELKAIAAKMNVSVPGKVSAKHQANIDKLSKVTGASFDTAYINDMVSDHQQDLSAFEKARTEVTNEELKKFIDDKVAMIRGHLEMAKKMKESK